MRAVLIPNYDDRAHFPISWHAAMVVLLTEERVHAFEHSFCYTAGLAQPDGRSDDQNVRRKNALTKLWPIVPLSFVGLHPRFNIVIYDANDLSLHIMLF